MGKILHALRSRPRRENCKKMIGREIVNKVIQDATGQEIDFPEVKDTDAIQVGDKAELNRKPIAGEFVMPDASIYRFVEGVLKKIIPPGKDAFAMRDRGAGARKYLASTRNKVNPTATPENRFAGILDRIKNYKRKNK